MCEARLLLRASQSQGRSHQRQRPRRDVGSRWIGGVRLSCDVGWLAATFAHLNSVPSMHIRCRMTASFRATAPLAFRKPVRLATLMPQALRADHFCHPSEYYVGCLVEVAPQHFVAALRDSACPVDLARCISPGRQTGLGAFCQSCAHGGTGSRLNSIGAGETAAELGAVDVAGARRVADAN